MSQTITTERPRSTAGALTTTGVHPSDILLNLVVTFLIPMFFIAGAGDLAFARMAALETIASYRGRNPADVIAVTQIIAFGLAALGSLSLSMVDDTSLSMTLRLRGNANACNRSAEQNRRALTQSLALPDAPEAPTPEPAPVAIAEPAPRAAEAPPENTAHEAAVMASLPDTTKPLAQALARPDTANPAAKAPLPALPLKTTAAGVPTETQIERLRAAAMTEVAGGLTTSIPHLPKAQCWTTSSRAVALSTCANELIAGVKLQPFRLGKIT